MSVNAKCGNFFSWLVFLRYLHRRCIFLHWLFGARNIGFQIRCQLLTLLLLELQEASEMFYLGLVTVDHDISKNNASNIYAAINCGFLTGWEKARKMLASTTECNHHSFYKLIWSDLIWSLSLDFILGSWRHVDISLCSRK